MQLGRPVEYYMTCRPVPAQCAFPTPKKKKMTSGIVPKRPKAGSKKLPPSKKFPFSPSFFFSPHSRTFFSWGIAPGHRANRFRLADLGGVEPLRKLVRPNPTLGSALVWIGLRLGRTAHTLCLKQSVTGTQFGLSFCDSS